MFWAILIIIVSVAAGTLLALLPRDRDAWMGPVRTLALMAALSVVVLHLLPEALSAAGTAAIPVFILGLFAPGMLGKLGVFLWRASHRKTSPSRRHKDLALEASYAGLLLHRLGDGIGIGAFTNEMFVGAGNGGVITALAAHCVPVVAIVVLAFDSVRGRGSALTRAFGLALASVLGVVFAHSIPAEIFMSANVWISAFVGGMLVHVVTHDLGVQLPKTAANRAWDLVAAALGVFISFLGRGAHEGHAHHDHSPGDFEHALVDFSIETAPLLLFGLVVGAALATLGTKIPERLFKSRGAVVDAARGTLIGAPLPLCSCSVLPISEALKGRGAAPAFVVAFLLATPELGVETFALSVRFLGWELAWMRLGGALLVAFGAALVVALVVKKGEAVAEPSHIAVVPKSDDSWWARALRAFDELFHHVGAWMILGIVAAALLEVGLPEEAFAALDGWVLQFAVITLVAVPSYVCAPSATPLAAVLLAKGLSPGAVLVGLLLGPATNVATLIFLRRWFGGKAAAFGVLAVVALAWLFGLLTDHFIGPISAESHTHAHDVHSHGALWMALSVFTGLLLLRALYNAGVRGFLSTLQGEHGHSHGDVDGPLGGGHAHSAHGDHGHAHGDHGHAHGDHGHAHGDHGHAHNDHGHGHGH